MEREMVTVGIRELKQQASQLIRMVRETGTEVQVTYHGQIVALLIPVKPTAKREAAKAWAKLDNLAAQIGARWPKGVSATDAISEARR
jgi:prevent-host-death family protein